MKTYQEFITENFVKANKLEKAINNKSHTFAELSLKDQQKLTALLTARAALSADPRARTGALAKQIVAASKKIDNFASKFGMTDTEIQKAYKK